MSKLSDKERRRESVKLHLLDEHLKAVGHVTLRAAILDKMIELTGERVARGLHKTLQKEYKEFSIPKKLSLIQDALTRDLPEFENAISEFISELNSVRYHRNDIVHKIWRSTDNPETKKLVELTHIDLPEKELRRVTAKTMMALATQMVDLTFEMSDWKMLANQSQLRQSAASRGIHPQLAALPPPPRISAKDLTKKQRLERRRAESLPR